MSQDQRREFDLVWEVAERTSPERFVEFVDRRFFDIAVANMEFDTEVDRRIRPLYDWEEER